MLSRTAIISIISLAVSPLSSVRAGEEPDLILHHGKIVTVDKAFTLQQALAIRGSKVLRVGSNEDILKQQGPHTQLLDREDKTVLPGLIDAHVHPNSACMIEFDHPIPEMEPIADVLAYIKSRAKVLSKGEWIEVHQVFITRLREQRYPTRRELDEAAPDNPVVFSTGPDASLNTLALKRSGIDKDFQVTDGGPGYAEKDEHGEPTGILRSCTRYVKSQLSGRQATELDRTERLLQLLKDYTSVGRQAFAAFIFSKS
jgi:predicted amidohydrolase YtcJ